MRFDIIHEIRRMEKKYHEKYGCRGEVVCLDAETEARIAAYLIDSYYRFPEIYVDKKHLIKDILEDGIRDMGLVFCGMRLKFNCSLFCIDEPPNYIPYFELAEEIQFRIIRDLGLPAHLVQPPSDYLQ